MFRWPAASLLLLVVSGACSGSSPAGPSAAADPLSAQVRLAVEEAIVDEYRAETIYLGVLDDFGSVLPFLNIIGAEERHSTALARVLLTRALPVPANPHSVASVPHFASITEACAAGVAAEHANVAIYDRYIGLNLPGDVRQVFQSNRAASLNNHLPAFERCAP